MREPWSYGCACWWLSARRVGSWLFAPNFAVFRFRFLAELLVGGALMHVAPTPPHTRHPASAPPPLSPLPLSCWDFTAIKGFWSNLNSSECSLACFAYCQEFIFAFLVHSSSFPPNQLPTLMTCDVRSRSNYIVIWFFAFRLDVSLAADLGVFNDNKSIKNRSGPKQAMEKCENWTRSP